MKNYLDDISEIKTMMEKSSRFLSLSGLSGISIGFIAIIATSYFYYLSQLKFTDDNYSQLLERDPSNHILYLAISVLILSLLFGLFFTKRKVKSDGISFYDPEIRRFLIDLSIPLITGGCISLILFSQGQYTFIAPFTLVFYGLALINSSKFTLVEIKQLGVIEILLGLLALYFRTYNLYFWVFGFGFMHIAYGTLMYMKYDRKKYN